MAFLFFRLNDQRNKDSTRQVQCTKTGKTEECSENRIIRRDDSESINSFECETLGVALVSAMFAPLTGGLLSFIIFWIVLETILIFFFCKASGFHPYHKTEYANRQKDKIFCEENEYYSVSDRLLVIAISVAVWFAVRILFFYCLPLNPAESKKTMLFA